MSRLEELLVCPTCHRPLVRREDGLACESCGCTYVVRDGIPCFAEPDPFYDQYSEVHCPYTPSPKGLKAMVLRTLPFWSYREWRFWRQALPAGGRLLDIGCGRGKEVFLERADETVGLDGSLAFLRGCREHYDHAVLASLPRLPFADASFDMVVSSHVIGHVGHEHKETLVSEIQRVLRPGGIGAFIIETDSLSRYIAVAKSRPDLYKQWLVDQDGHIGLELASRVVERFERHGMRLRLRRAVDMLTPSVMYYDKYLAHDGLEDLPGLGVTRALRRLNGLGPVGNLTYEFGFGIFHRTFEQWLGDYDRGNFVHVAFEKVA